MTYPHRVAMISMHTSPLATPGVGDAGGLNVYVARWPAGLANVASRSMCSPAPSRPHDPLIVEMNEHTRVINVPAGPADPRAKEELPDWCTTSVAQLDGRMPGYDLIHSHYWLSGLVGVQLAARHRFPWCTRCTRWPGSRTPPAARTS